MPRARATTRRAGRMTGAWFVVCVACAWTRVARAAVLGPFTSRAQLKTAVDNCLAADATGACDCSQPSVDCGPAGSLPISQWDVSQVDDMNVMFNERQRVQSADRELGHEFGDANG